MVYRTWSPNPYAIAELLLGKNVDVHGWDAQGVRLEDVYQIERRLLFDPVGKRAARFALFQGIADLGGKPTSLDEVMNLPLVVQARRLYSDEQIQRILPFLIPIDDAKFKAPGKKVASGKFVGEYRPVDKFIIDGATFLDPVQGGIADCYLISSLIALAWVQSASWRKFIDHSTVARAGKTKFHFKLFRGPSTRAPALHAPGDVPFDNEGRQCFARSETAQEGWPSIVEKAYVMRRCGKLDTDPQPADYQTISHDGELPQQACQMLVGGKARSERNLELDPKRPWHHFPTRCDARGIARFPTMAWTWKEASHLRPLTFVHTGLIPNHAYAVLGTTTRDGNSFMVLRNPHGVSLAGTARPPEYLTGTWEPGAADGVAPVVKLDELGVFGLPMKWFNRCFDAMGWVEPLLAKRSKAH